MRTTLHWHTQAGTLTVDNRDACAHIEQAHASLYLIADGSSSYPRSGELATALLAGLAQGFGHLPVSELNPEQLAEALLQIIASSHQALRDAHPHAACSYLVLCLLADAAFSIHEGDCCLGLVEQSGQINWLSGAHCAANWQGNLTHAELAQAPSRHRLTRCFSARRASDPEINHWPLGANQHWLLATDGFWAGLSDPQQQTFLRDGRLPAPPTDDDISCLSLITSLTG
jgi:serine/threonine protein phosphatase PrpC